MSTCCTNCQFENPAGMRFCGNCGTRLPESSDQPAASARLPKPDELGVLIGGDLAERLRRAGIEAAGQRRNVTVLFADLSGYTTLAGKVDAEDLYDLVQQYIRLLMNSVYQYEGVVDKLTGDGIMALFGAPIAHENNAELAVLAALDMQHSVEQLSKEMEGRLGRAIEMRVGLHSGSVIVGGIGSDLLMNYTAIGDTVNLARRLEESAPNGAILVSEAVYRQVQPLFDCPQATMLNPKGIAYPVAAYRVLGHKIRPGSVRGLEGLQAPMIGRDRELKSLQNAFEKLLLDRQSCFTLITGEAGLGKSRLTREFQSKLPSVPLRVITGHSLTYRRSVSYWLFQDALLNYLGVSINRSQALQVRERLVQAVYKNLGTVANETLPYLEHMLSLPPSDPAAAERIKFLDGSQLRQKIFLAVRDLLQAEARRQPLLLVLEDLHWADDVSLELLHYLLQSFRSEPVFFLAISRQGTEGMLARTVEWAQRNMREKFELISLLQLSAAQSSLLLAELLANPAFPEGLRQLILQRAAGIPFYLEEILRMLIDQDAIHFARDKWEIAPGAENVFHSVPESIQGLILARFDRLPGGQRHLLQVAAVIGKSFNLPVLSYVLEQTDERLMYDGLQSLVQRDFIQPTGDGEGQYSFRHILMSDAIYATLLKRDLRQLHGKVGEAIETLYADSLDNQVELLANHYRYSSQPERALHYLVLAGEKASRNNTNAAARNHFNAALALLEEVNSPPYRVYQVQAGMGDALFFDGDYPGARNHYRTGLAAFDTLPVELYAAERGLMGRKIARTYERQSDYEQATRHLNQAQTILQNAPMPEPEALAQVWNDLAWIHYRRGNSGETLRLLQDALKLVQSSSAYDVVASILNRLGGVAYSKGDWGAAADYLRQSIAIRQQMDDLIGLAASFNNLGFLEIEMGELDSALENLTHSYELKNRLGQPEGMAAALNNLGWLRIQRGELDEARQSFNQAEALLRQIGYTSLLWQTRKNIGEMHLAAGEFQEAHRVLSGVVPFVEEARAYDQLLDICRLLGESALRGDDLPSAVGWDQKAHETIVRLGEGSNQLPVVTRGELARFRGLLSIRLGAWGAARHHLEDSQRIFESLHSPLYQGRIASGFGALDEAQGLSAEAQEHYQEAVVCFERSGARLEARRAAEAKQRVADAPQNP